LIKCLLVVLYNGHYYRWYQQALNYQPATADAARGSINGMPGHLVTFNSNDEFVAVSAMFDRLSGFVGLTDTEIEGTFTFAGGPESGMTGLISAFDANTAQGMANRNERPKGVFWFGDQNNQNNEDCVEVAWHGFFNDVSCDQSRFYIVEYDCPGVLIPSAYGCLSTICSAI
jgi:hypothetical protein